MCSVTLGIIIIFVAVFFPADLCHSTAFINASHIRLTRETIKNSCQLPQHPKFGKWQIYQQTSQLPPGASVPSYTFLHIQCNENYKLIGQLTIGCIRGKWTYTVGQCLQTCPSLYSTPFMTVTCNQCDTNLENCTEPLEGTQARFKCADFYEDAALKRYPVSVCRNGKWTSKPPECLPTCGRKFPKQNPTLIVGGTNATIGDLPWQVALYNAKTKVLLCGGSLINPRVILTAAHCVSSDKGELYSPDLYVAAVGKYYQGFDDPRDLNQSQFSPVQKMYKPNHFRGSILNYYGDIAILVTKKIFKLSFNVQPVCVDWEAQRMKRLLGGIKKKHGLVSGWGFTKEFGHPSGVLKVLKVPLVSEEKCLEELEDYSEYLTADKICAGFLNSSASACRGDSGGGLVFKFGKQYYVTAVVSISPNALDGTVSCSSQKYTLYTSVSFHSNFISEKEAEYRPSLLEVECDGDSSCQTSTTTTERTTTSTTSKPVSKNDCVLPLHPDFGEWSVIGFGNKAPNSIVPMGVILKMTCAEGYSLNGNALSFCENGKWQPNLGQCFKSCSIVKNTKTTTYTCSVGNQTMRDCSKAFEGTVLKYSCAPFYEDLQGSRNPLRICRNGTWDLEIPVCVPVCGRRRVDATPLIVNGTDVRKGDFPWQAALYKLPGKILICAGSLLTESIILTGAICVTEANGKVLPTQNYIVAVGKYYRRFNDSRDYGDAQYSEIQDIFVPRQYQANIQNYQGDIAVLVTQKQFTFSRTIQPVCLDLAHQYTPKWNEYGYVAGWGYTEEYKKPSENMKELQVPLVSTKECDENLPEDFNVYLTADKFCAGYLNKGTSVCRGDGGAGLVVKNDHRYYITGIVSVSPKAPTVIGGCNSQQYTIYTKVSTYIDDFILPILEANKVNQEYILFFTK